MVKCINHTASDTALIVAQNGFWLQADFIIEIKPLLHLRHFGLQYRRQNDPGFYSTGRNHKVERASLTESQVVRLNDITQVARSKIDRVRLLNLTLCAHSHLPFARHPSRV